MSVPALGSSSAAAAAAACQPILLRQPLAGVLQEFAITYSWLALFADAPGGTHRNQRNDGEPDDLLSLAQLALELNSYYHGTGNLPIWNIIVSEGDENLLQGKALAQQMLLAQMCVQGLIEPPVLGCFHYYYDKPLKIDAEKQKGFEEIIQAAGELDEKYRVLVGGMSRPQPVAALYQKQDDELTAALQQGQDPKIVEGCFAPVDGLTDRYTQHPEFAPHVTQFGYGSFNLDGSIQRTARASVVADPHKDLAQAIADRKEQVSGMFGKFKHASNLEAYLATRKQAIDRQGRPAVDDKGRPVFKDFNRAGKKSHPEIFAPLLKAAEDEAPSVLKFFCKAMQGWNKNTVDKLTADFRRLFGNDSFVDDLKERIARNSSFDLRSAIQLFNDRHLEQPREEDAARRSIYDNKDKKIKILHDILSNLQLQGTLSDLTVALLMSDPRLINPDCIYKANLALKYEESRVNTVFDRAEGGRNAYAITSDVEKGMPGIDPEVLAAAVAKFMERLSGKPSLPQDAVRV